MLQEQASLVVEAMSNLSVSNIMPDMPFMELDPEEFEEKYGDPEDPAAKAYIPPGWKTVYLWRAPDLWF
tara:strand:- start:235 stop:441 length:207 start_codon:yes stop_codon:yes gene_type:complete